MTENKNNELFPDSSDPKRKLRGFSRAPSVSTAPVAPPTKQPKAQAKKKPTESGQEAKGKRIVIKGYKSLQIPPIDLPRTTDQVTTAPTVSKTKPSIISGEKSVDEATTVDEERPAGSPQQKPGFAKNPITKSNLQTISEETGNLGDTQGYQGSESSLEYCEYTGTHQVPDSSDAEDNWVKTKKVKVEPEGEKREEGRLLTGLVSSPSLKKEKQKDHGEPPKEPSKAQASALLEICEALDVHDYEKHAKLMTAYLLRYNPEKIRVLAAEKQTGGLHAQPINESQPATTDPRVMEVGKIRPPRAAEKYIPPGRPRSEDGDEPKDPIKKGEDFVENGIEFADGQVPSHHMTQLTVFWDNRIRKIKGYVPISMFNKAWLEANRDVKGRKPTRKKSKEEEEDSDDEKYKGLTYPNELRLTYGDWVTCFTLFLDYLRDWFHFKKLVSKFEGHRRNVESVKRENDDNWMVALRYDIMIRRQFWTTRVEGGKVSDPSVRQKKIE
ncbi:hypothetical protein DFH28DRAFT_870225, partial [Melampsora americana]